MKVMWRRFVIGGIMCVMLAIGLMPRETAKGAVPVIDLGSGNVTVSGSSYPEVIIESDGVQIDRSITINADANMTVIISNVNISTDGAPIYIYGSGNVTLLLD